MTLDTRQVNGKYTAHGAGIDVEISPCCLSIESYGFQFRYYIGNDSKDVAHGWGYLHDKKVKGRDGTPADVQRMLDSMLELSKCSVCGVTHLFDANSNRGRKCEACFMAEIRANLDELTAQENAKELKRDRKMYKQGMRFKTVAWVHPDGDDYSMAIYTVTKPTQSEIAAILKKKRSSVLDDWSVEELKA